MENTHELKTRVKWGLPVGLLLLAFILFLGPNAIFLLSILLGLQGWNEYSRLMGLTRRKSLYYAGFLFVAMMNTYAFLLSPSSFFWIWLLWIAGFFILYLETLFLKQERALEIPSNEQNWKDLCRFILGVLYVFMLYGFLGPVMLKPHGVQLVILGVALIFIGDTSAYFMGKSRGKNKMWPELSPGKTWEGALGGMAGSFIAALLTWVVFHYATQSSVSFWTAAFLGVLAPPLAQAGDFLESLMKRASGFKDSGAFLPGHGGLLDRTDGFVFVIPLIYFLFSAI